MKTETTSSRRIWQRVDVWISYLALTVLIVLGVVLTATVPRTTEGAITLDITCTSGNPVVSVWIDASLVSALK